RPGGIRVLAPCRGPACEAPHRQPKSPPGHRRRDRGGPGRGLRDHRCQRPGFGFGNGSVDPDRPARFDHGRPERGGAGAGGSVTTTMLTLTITGIFADGHLGGGTSSKVGRRVLSPLAMFGGALAGALLILHADGWVSVELALALLCLVAARAWLLAHHPQPDASAG